MILKLLLISIFPLWWRLCSFLSPVVNFPSSGRRLDHSEVGRRAEETRFGGRVDRVKVARTTGHRQRTTGDGG